MSLTAFDLVDLDAPFRPERYQEAVEALTEPDLERVPGSP